ncbi:MAG: ParB/RepB/Spo0J family partition protein [Clostridia bacterium]|nr:ParB/RepB/Spo0J family partition protein [Clostridia bacterium]
MINKGLGRGLDAIFLDTSVSGETSGGTRILRITEIEPRSDQPRKVFDEQALSELADSIAANGLIQPIVVRDNGNGYYGIVAGERRWRACKLAGLTEVPVVILNVDDAKAAELALIENIQREDLNPVEESAAYKALADQYGLTQEEIASRVGKSRAEITNKLRLLDLPEPILGMISDGELSYGHARALLGLKNTGSMVPLARMIIENGISVRRTEELVKKHNEQNDKPPAKTASLRPENINWQKELEKKLTRRLGRKTTIKRSRGVNRIELVFRDDDDLDTLVRQIAGSNIFDE